MFRGLTASACVLAITSVALGWSLGYHSPATYIVFWLWCALVFGTARTIEHRFFPRGDAAGAIIRTSVVAFAEIVVAGLLLGGIGWIGVVQYSLFFLVAFGAALSISTTSAPVGRALLDPAEGGSQKTRPTYVLGTHIIGAGLALLVVIIAVGIIQSPQTLYDSLSYHLVFPARWLQDHQISIVPTPFSDPAQAYQPSNGELFLLWLMLPFHGDVFARIGQIPFLLLAAVALYAVARRLGAGPAHAVYAPVFFALSRSILEQAVGADVDLISSALFASTIYLGITAVDRDQPADWLIFGTSAGLFCGTKYLALIYAPLFVVLSIVRGVRRKSLWAIPGLAAMGLPWYLRNWIVAGSPIYPATLGVGGVTIATGAYSRAAMANSVFHARGAALWSVVVAHAFGPTLVLVWIPLAAVAIASVVRERRWWPGGVVILLLAAMFPLEWFNIPDNIDARFLFPAITTAMLLPPLAFGRSARRNAAVHVFCAAGALWILIGAHREIAFSTLPWYTGGWLSLDGLVSTQFVAPFIALAVVASLVWVFSARAPAWRRALVTIFVAATTVTLAAGTDVWCAPDRCDYLRLSSIFVRPPVLDAWNWVAEHMDHAAIANTGNNLPYPLFGKQLTNRVYYVNVDRHLTWRLHDYARARARSGATPPATPLAESSGELVPAPHHDPSIDASRPRYERIEGHREGWIANLKALGVDYLYVSTLSAYEIDYQWHNDGGFPIEDEWARQDPGTFSIVFENSMVRVYRVSPH